MTIKRETLEAAASVGVLKYGQIDNLFVFLAQQELKTSRQSAAIRFYTGMLMYLAGMLVAAGAVLFAFMAVNALGIGALLWCAALYALCAIGAAAWCAHGGMRIAATLLALVAMISVACAVFAVQSLQGSWAGGIETLLSRDLGAAAIDARWLTMEAAALIVAIGLMLWLRLPFLALASAAIVWVIGVEAAPALVAQADAAYQLGIDASAAQVRLVFTLVAGLALIALGLAVDLRRRAADAGFAFWLYCAGLIAFTAGSWLLSIGLPMGALLFGALHVGLIAAGVMLGRRVFQLFGFVGIACLVMAYTWTALRHTEAFVPVLTATSLALLALPVWWLRRERYVAARVRRMLPNQLRSKLPARIA